jgi:hypothetical protein
VPLLSVDKLHGDVLAGLLRKSLLRNRELLAALNRAWPVIDAADLVADLWSVPAYLRLCAPWLSPGEVRQLQRLDAQAWTASDLPLLDAARHRLGDPQASRRRRREEGRRRRTRVHGRRRRRLEFDPVILINPETSGTGIKGTVDRYVTMTRATQQLVILTSS